MRSFSEMKLDSTLSSVVLPAPVPPLISALSRGLHAMRQELEHRLGQRAPASPDPRPAAVPPENGNRQQRAVHRSGGMFAVDARAVRSRASTIGELSSTRRPTALTIRSMTRIR